MVADAGDERPLVMEIKLFDPARGYDRGYLRQGFRQIYDYTTDYGQAVGYLVVFNCVPQALVIRTKDETKGWPPRVELNNRTFFIIVIDLATPEESASKRGPLKPYIIEESDLTSEALDSADNEAVEVASIASAMR